MLNKKQRQALLSLGTTKERVAQNLRVMGIKGKRLTCKDCPIGKLLNKERSAVARWLDFPVIWLEEVISEPKYAAVEKFTLAFDRGDFPELIEKGER